MRIATGDETDDGKNKAAQERGARAVLRAPRACRLSVGRKSLKSRKGTVD
jgi:hypothetical protein